MPKIIELTVEIDIQKVSCPGVWLCQGGRVCLTVFALGTSYQTCLLPPVFPLMFKDVFYFKKRFQQSCALNNICCLLKDETIYCELVQCGTKCVTEECMILAQYLGAMNDVLFPPNMCSNDGVDLLMRRSKLFPGILSPKIEIATKVRIDEVWDQPCHVDSTVKVHACHCGLKGEGVRQKQVCHSARYHQARCNPRRNSASRSSSRSRSRSAISTSLNSLNKNADHCSCTNCKHYARPRRRSGLSQLRDYYVYNVQTSTPEREKSPIGNQPEGYSEELSRSTEALFDAAEKAHGGNLNYEDEANKVTLESRYIDQENYRRKTAKDVPKMYCRAKTSPCVCEICRRYHELFHSNK
ncbi:unnamed protein product [Arctia plantaginis]|uniref:Spermatogenesis-associated protein 6 N-terminal domain-containing protein n=1 Tax=Arctia plantaginis TaxID=874455 RepID=A0A8S1ADA3_ARCPL|nr:unnamed protein product [Arctia plantaginis]